MTYYIIQDGHIHDATNDEETALYSLKQLEATSGRPAEIAKTVIQLGEQNESR